MKIDQKSFEKSSPAAPKRVSTGFKLAIAAALIGLGLLHIVGDAVFRGSSAAVASGQNAQPHNYGD